MSFSEVRQSAQQTGYASESCLNELKRDFGSRQGGEANLCYFFSHMAVEGLSKLGQTASVSAETPGPEECKKMILNLVDAQERKLKDYVNQKKRLVYELRYGEITKDIVLDEISHLKRDRNADLARPS